MNVIIFYLLSGLLSAMGFQAQSGHDPGMSRASELSGNQNPIEATDLYEPNTKTEKDQSHYAFQWKIPQSFSMTRPAEQNT